VRKIFISKCVRRRRNAVVSVVKYWVQVSPIAVILIAKA